MASVVDSGFGASVTFDSTFFGQIRSIEFDGMSREALDTTNNSTSTAATFIPSDIFDYGSVTIEHLLDTDDAPAISSAAETVTVTFPLGSGQSTAANWQFSGFMTGFSASVPYDGIMTATATLKVSANITFNASV